MPFQLEKVTQVTVTNANPRRELHGEDRVRAIDISFSITGENTLLDLIEPGLREHHYFNKAMTSGQEPLPGVIVPLPNLRYPKLPQAYAYGKGDRLRGYRFIWDWGTEGDHVDFTDVVLTGLHYDLQEGGSVTVRGTIQYNGDELQDNDVYGELSGLASEGEIYIKLLAPGELLPAKKGYRAGKPDTPQQQVPADGDGKTAGDIFAEQHGDQGDGDGDGQGDGQGTDDDTPGGEG
ncbi:hypothetical protein ACQ858_08215 [Variovorax ureilyticus]|uniref:hypothetical protein n=1 Tax=Variovorax ureilyticus TaxID=1836198 RepID=UPI003D672B29